jgi:membrane fusion protein, multidrug efflux system
MSQAKGKSVKRGRNGSGTHAGNGNPPTNGRHSFEPEQKQLAPPAEETEQKLLEPPLVRERTPPKTEPEKKQAPRRRKWPWILAGLLALVVMYFVFHSGTKSTTADKKGSGAGKGRGGQGGAAITVGQSKTGNMNIYVDALGTVTPTYTVTVYSQITGRVMAVHYQEGQMVKQGDPLVEIDPRPYEATLTQAEGTLEHDQGLLAEARMDLQRYKAAYDKNAIAKQTVDDQAATVTQDEGTVKADQGTVDYDRVQLAYCHIVAPITGRVGLRLVDPGNTVFAGSASTLVVITQLQPITVVFNVSEDDLAQIQTQLKGGRQLSVDAFDRANEKLIESGKLTSLDNEVDTTTGTIKFRAEFPNKNLSLFPNQFVNARLLVKTLSGVVLVPSAAVQHNGTNAFVYVVTKETVNQANNNEDSKKQDGKKQDDKNKDAKNKDGNTQGANTQGAKVSVQQITVLATDDQNTAVQGLNPGVNLATSGFDRLENGVEVTVRPGTGQSNNQSQQQKTESQGGASSPAGGRTP